MSVSYFLGANSCQGFYSLYEEFCRAEGDYLHLIKAGPGGGKSGFMRRIAKAAEDRGLEVEYLICSGDPDSLDGIYIPKLHLGYLDATAPHVTEPRYFGFDSCYVSLGRFCSASPDDKIREYAEKYHAMYKRAYAFLAAAGEVKRAEIPELISKKTIDKVKNKARSAFSRELGSFRSLSAGGRMRRRFIRCISCKGELCLSDSVQELCKRIYLLDDRCGLADVYLREIGDIARGRCVEVILCPSPLCPELLDAVLLPEYGLGFVSASAADIKNPWRHVRLDALIPTESMKVHRPELKRAGKLYCALTAEGINWLKKAKEYHDLLEKAYNPHVDFKSLNAFCDSEIGRIFG